MKAAVLHSFGSDLVIEDVTLSDPEPDEVLIRIVASGVCHPDPTIQKGAQRNRPIPLLLGHEIAGVVTRVGKKVTEVVPGDHVITCLSSSCGGCEWCAEGHQQHCTHKPVERAAGHPPRLSMNGEKLNALAGLGGFAQEALVHEQFVTKMPREMPLDRAALLGCAVITGMGAVRNAARVRIGDTVAVIGCGGVGLNAIQGARIAGASRIIAIDRIGGKEELARTLGATDFIDAGACDPVEAVKELTSGGVHHAIEVVGAPATIEQAFGMLRNRGTASVLGVAHPEAMARIRAMDFMLEKRIQGVRMGSAAPRSELPVYAQMYLNGQLKLDELITHRLPLSDVNFALQNLDNPMGARTILMMEQ